MKYLPTEYFTFYFFIVTSLIWNPLYCSVHKSIKTPFTETSNPQTKRYPKIAYIFYKICNMSLNFRVCFERSTWAYSVGSFLNRFLNWNNRIYSVAMWSLTAEHKMATEDRLLPDIIWFTRRKKKHWWRRIA
jgi:hypothetical protein